MFNVVFDGDPTGALGALTTRGSAQWSIPVVGVEGYHTVEIFGGQGGEAFLNKHETSWPWEPTFRWSFEMDSHAKVAQTETGGESEGISPLYIIIAVLVIGAATFAAGLFIRRKGPQTSNGNRIL